jgi:hypothetical protein
VDQLWVEVEENPNSEYLPMRVFETRGEVTEVDALVVEGLNPDGSTEVIVGWSSDGDGAPTGIQFADVTDSGAAVSVLVVGGDYGLRIRPATSTGAWSLENSDERGEPYLLLPPETKIRLADSR